MMNLFVTFIVTILFCGPNVLGKNEETIKFFNEATKISDDLLNTPVCIKATGKEKGDEFLYTHRWLNEITIMEEAFCTSVYWPINWAITYWRELDEKVNPKYVFFTPPLDLQKNLPQSIDFYKEYKWKLIPQKNFGWDTFEIRNHITNQLLLIKGKIGRSIRIPINLSSTAGDLSMSKTLTLISHTVTIIRVCGTLNKWKMART